MCVCVQVRVYVSLLDLCACEHVCGVSVCVYVCVCARVFERACKSPRSEQVGYESQS